MEEENKLVIARKMKPNYLNLLRGINIHKLPRGLLHKK